jgi:hypothetical protein
MSEAAKGLSSGHAPPHWCKNLRWKDHERDSASLALVARAFTEGGDVYTCLMTAQTAGWDDGLASPEGCGPRRSCYEAHPLLQITKRPVA